MTQQPASGPRPGFPQPEAPSAGPALPGPALPGPVSPGAPTLPAVPQAPNAPGAPTRPGVPPAPIAPVVPQAPHAPVVPSAPAVPIVPPGGQPWPGSARADRPSPFAAMRPYLAPPQQPAWAPAGRAPSGLFPSAPAPPVPGRPTYVEPHPVRGAALAAGAGVTALWLLLFGLLGGDLRGYAWWTALAGGLAWLVALGLGRLGDRGVAVGIAIVTSAGWSIAATAVAVRWATTTDWPLW